MISQQIKDGQELCFSSLNEHNFLTTLDIRLRIAYSAQTAIIIYCQEVSNEVIISEQRSERWRAYFSMYDKLYFNHKSPSGISLS